MEIDVWIKHFEGICEGLTNSTGEIKEMETRNKPLNDKEGLLGGQGKEIYWPFNTATLKKNNLRVSNSNNNGFFMIFSSFPILECSITEQRDKWILSSFDCLNYLIAWISFKHSQEPSRLEIQTRNGKIQKKKD